MSGAEAGRPRGPDGGSASPWAHLWLLRPDVLYLNHGSFGACPREVLDFQRTLRHEMEREPTDFLVRELPGRIDEARAALAAFVDADPAGLAFVANATTAVNAVAASLDLAPGDELLATDHAYPACRKALERVASLHGARVVVAPVPFPVESDDEIVDAILASVSHRTRLALVDHVASPTAIVFPAERIVRELEAVGVDTLVDGAHALGMIPLDLARLGAAYYTANAHKWLCAPKGAAFLHVREDRRRLVHPTVISHGYDPTAGGAHYRAEFDWTGTFDPTAWLAIPECLRFLESLVEGGWPALMARNRDLALRARSIVAEALEVPLPCPERMVAAMASIPLPSPSPGSVASRGDHEALTAWLRTRGIEAWFHPWRCEGGIVARVSAQLYNDERQYHELAIRLREAVRGRP